MNNLLTAEYGWTEEDDVALRQSVEDQLAVAVEFGLNGKPMQVAGMETMLYAE